MWSSSGRWGGVLAFSGALVAACGSSSAGDPHAAAGSGAAGAFTRAGDGNGNGAGGANASGGASGTSGETGARGGGVNANGGASGTPGGAGAAGAAQSGGMGGAGGAQNVFLAQLSLGQGGGPPRCFPRSLPSGLPGTPNDGQVSCFVAELKPGSCDCAQTARAPLPAAFLTAAVKQLAATGSCDGSSGVSCDALCGCEIVQASGTASNQSSDLYACQNELTPAPSVDGFCFIDQTRTDESGAPAPLGNPAIVAECPSNDQRLLRFVGAASPASGANMLLGCSGTAL